MCLLDLQASESFEHYSISDKAMDYRLLQMDEDQDRMYVGCKDHVLSMDINNITHGTLKVSRCLLLQLNRNALCHCSVGIMVRYFFFSQAQRRKHECYVKTLCKRQHDTTAEDIIVMCVQITMHLLSSVHFKGFSK